MAGSWDFRALAAARCEANPLLIPQVAEQVFSFLGFGRDLEACACVCTLWHESITEVNVALWRQVWARKYGSGDEVPEDCAKPAQVPVAPAPAVASLQGVGLTQALPRQGQTDGNEGEVGEVIGRPAPQPAAPIVLGNPLAYAQWALGEAQIPLTTSRYPSRLPLVFCGQDCHRFLTAERPPVPNVPSLKGLGYDLELLAELGAAMEGCGLFNGCFQGAASRGGTYPFLLEWSPAAGAFTFESFAALLGPSLKEDSMIVVSGHVVQNTADALKTIGCKSVPGFDKLTADQRTDVKVWLEALAKSVMEGAAWEHSLPDSLPAPGAYKGSVLESARTCLVGTHRLLNYVQGNQLEQVAYYKHGRPLVKLLAGLSPAGNVVGLLTAANWAAVH